MALACEAGPSASIGQKPTPRLARGSLSSMPGPRAHDLLGILEGRVLGYRWAQRLCAAWRSQLRGIQPWHSSGRPPPPDGEVRLGAQYACESGGRAGHAASRSFCSPAPGLGRRTSSARAVGALGAAQEDPGWGQPESQGDSHCLLWTEVKEATFLFTTRKKKEWARD